MNQPIDTQPVAILGTAELEEFVQGIDCGIESHGLWSQMLMRCALLHESPGDEVMQPDAHLRCRFGAWFAGARARLDEFDAVLAQRIALTHQTLHQSVCAMCARALIGEAVQSADYESYEQSQAELVRLLQAFRHTIEVAATRRDAITGLPMRHDFEPTFELRCKDARRNGQALWVAMIDVDRFKPITDIHGAAVGEVVLRHVAQTLSACLRESDILIGTGDEMFVGLFLIAGHEGVSAVGQRLLDALCAAPLRTHYGLVLPLTATVGWAHVRPDEGLPGAEERALQALRQGKAHGRNRFELAPA